MTERLVIVITLVMIAHSLSSPPRVRKTPDCLGCHVPDLTTYKKYKEYWDKYR